MCSYIVGISLFFFIFFHGIGSQKLCQNKICVFKCCPDEQIIITDLNSHCEKSNSSIPLSSLKEFKVIGFAGSSKNETVGTFEDFFHLDNKTFKFEFILGNSKYLGVTELYEDGNIINYMDDEEPIRRDVKNYCVGWNKAGELIFGYYNTKKIDDIQYESLSRIASGEEFEGDLTHIITKCNKFKLDRLILAAQISNLCEDESDGVIDLKFILIFYVTCIFLLLVLIVYGMLKELRNFEGKMFICYVFSIFCALTLFTTFRTLNYYEVHMTEINMLLLSFFVYLFFMASFLWMNVISFDLWRSLRRMRVNRRLDRVCRFRVYSAYAWGVALALSINLIVLEKLDASTIPWCFKPEIVESGIFLHGHAKLLYLYTPMLIILLCNLIFFILTVILLWRSYCDTRLIANTNKKRQTIKKRFVLYIKLSLVMGISWILEVTSYFDSDDPFWIVTDYYNLLVGPMIFIFFICKKKIFKALCAKLRPNGNQERNESSDSSTAKTNVVLREL